MAVAEPKADVPGVTRPMTYEEYMASPEEMARYDILDGWKVYRLYGEQQLSNPTRLHQRIVANILAALRAYEQEHKRGEALVAPCDVAIINRPLHTRQPDVLFISSERLAHNPPSTDPAPLSPAPELVVEILSASDKPAVLAAKVADYHSVDVREVWVVRTGVQTVELVRLSVDEIETVGTYNAGEAVASLVFDGLAVNVDDVFAQ